MYLLILYFLFVSFFTSFFFGRFFSKKTVGYFTSLCVFLSLCISVFTFYEVGLNNSPCVITLFSLIHLDLLDLHFNFLFDSLTVSMLIVVTFISFLVHNFCYAIAFLAPKLER